MAGLVGGGANPPLAWIAIAFCALIAAIVSIMVVIPSLASAADNRPPGPKLSALARDAYLRRQKANDARRAAMAKR